ncbi:sensor histidine kinase [Lonsdalea quercina]|uniref:sensor histidine kinase n=1 Tax=Lonsdalea quercina TaxID=71657 RepID=UPI0039747735
MFESPVGLSHDWASLLFRKMIISFGYGYSALFSALLLRWMKPSLSEAKINYISLICCILFGSLNAYFWFSPFSSNDFFLNQRSTLVPGFILAIVSFTFFSIHEQKSKAQNALEVAKRQQLEQKKALALSQLKQLQSQIEPHFLFNTMANLDVLIDKDSALAKLLLVNLTSLLRGSLKNYRNDYVNIDEELALIDAYLSIQKIRLGVRLDYEIRNEFNAGDFFIPPMLIQPLIENAIRHGIEPQHRTGTIEVAVRKEVEGACIQVIDNGCGLSMATSSCGHGLALENIRQRLDAIYMGKARLCIKENACQGVTAEIFIPLMATNSTQGMRNDKINNRNYC